MKFMIATAALLFALGTTAPAYGQQDKRDGGHSQGGHSQGGHSQSGRSQSARPSQQQHPQQSGRTGQQQTNAGNRSQQRNGGSSQTRMQQTRSTGGNSGNGGYARNGGNGGSRGNYAHGRISDDRYASSFGSGHSFHVNRGDYDRRRFEYGGYSFGFIDPWPVGWGYSDDVYVVYDGGGYFMYDRFHPGLRISVNIL